MSKPDILFDYQKLWLLDTSPVKVAEKSRRIGLTWAEQLDAVLIAYASKEAGGSDYLYISTKLELAKEFIDGCADWINYLYPWEYFPVNNLLIKDKGKDIKAFVINFPSGFSIYALSSNPSNMRGMQGVACIDEAAHQDSLNSLLKAAFAFLMWGGKVRIISTHHGESNEFNTLIKSIRSGDKKKFSLHSYDIDYALKDGLFKRICLVNGEEWSQEKENLWLVDLVASYGDAAEEELYCRPSASGSNYFNLSQVEAATSEDNVVVRLRCSQEFIRLDKVTQTTKIKAWLESEIKPLIDNLLPLNYKTFAGLDFGRSHDLTVLSLLIEKIGASRVVPFMVELRNCPYHCQKIICEYIFRKMKKFRRAAFDATGNGAWLAEELTMTFGSYKIESVKFSEKEYLTRYPRYKSALQGGQLKIPDDQDVIDDHMAVELINGIPKVPTTKTFTGKDSLPRHGDAAVSLMLAFSCTPIESKKKIPQLPTSGSLRLFK